MHLKSEQVDLQSSYEHAAGGVVGVCAGPLIWLDGDGEQAPGAGQPEALPAGVVQRAADDR